MPLLDQMHDAAEGKGLVRKMLSQRAMARGRRAWLRKAGVKREALHKTTSVSLNIRFHDCRARCGTWHAVLGRSGPEIRDLSAISGPEMTDVYLRDATAVRGGLTGRSARPPERPPIGHRIVSDVSGFTDLA